MTDIDAEVMQALRTMASYLESSLTASREVEIILAHNEIMHSIWRWFDYLSSFEGEEEKEDE